MYRNVCFTVNNYDEDEWNRILENPRWSYVICGREVGEEGTPHIQGYGELGTRTKYNTVHRAIFADRAHCENRKGTQDEAIEYCKKDENYEERGVRRNQGARVDLDRIRNIALDLGMRQVVRVGNGQQIRVAEKFLEYNEEARDWKPRVMWIYGATGVGKSRRARELLGEDVYVKNNGSKWWPGYDGHSDVIIDDFRDKWFGGEIEVMLSLLDRYECKVEFKGGQRQFLARNIIITSPFHPRDCFRGGIEDIQQLLRRIDEVILLDPEVVDPEVGRVILEDLPPI